MECSSHDKFLNNINSRKNKFQWLYRGTYSHVISRSNICIKTLQLSNVRQREHCTHQKLKLKMFWKFHHSRGAGKPKDRRRTRSQYQNEHDALSLTNSLPTEWCNEIPGKCYMMRASDQPLGPQKKKIDHSPPLPSRRNTQVH